MFLLRSLKETVPMLFGSPAPSGSSFIRQMQALEQATGIPLRWVRPTSAMFGIAYEGRRYDVVLLERNPSIVVNALSNILFPRGGVPHRIQYAMSHLSDRLGRCSYEV